MNDRRILRQFANGVLTNGVTAVIVVISIVLFVVSIPLVLLGS
jgi:hypothetical protein